MSNAEVRIVFNDVLSDGTDVPREISKEFRRQVVSAIHWLPPGVTCDIGDLVTPEFWLPLGKYLRSKLGRFLARWVADGELPLEFVGSPKRPNKRYRLRQ
jgi:hypothetical protein